MGISQIIMIVLLGVSIISHSVTYGKDQNISKFIGAIISAVILVVLLITGGYFD